MRRNTDRHVDPGQLADAAVALAFAEGLCALTHDALATRCGTAPRAVQQLRPDLAPLVAETFTRIVGADLAEVRRLVLAHPSPMRQLQVLLVTLAAPERAGVDTVRLESWSLGGRSPLLGAAVREQEGAWHALVAAVLRRGVRSGDFLPVDVEDVTARVLATIGGVTAYALVGYRSGPDRMRLLTAIATAELGVRFDEPRTQAQVYAQAEARVEAGAEEDAEARAVAWADAELHEPARVEADAGALTAE